VKEIKVQYRLDHTMATDVFYGEAASSKVNTGGRGYVRLPGRIYLYAEIQKVSIREVDAAGEEVEGR
jgi:hypothetical protein